MGLRLDLHEILEAIAGPGRAYFQPPANIKMTYPCIIYQRNDALDIHANNHLYRATKRYQVTVIDRNPDSAMPGEVSQLPLTEFDRFYTADNLNHDVFNVYF